jgi:large subunit ribosomal protein L32
MALPARHTSKNRRNNRRSHHAKVAKVLAICPKCKSVVNPHCICSNCGEYKGKMVVDVLKNLTKKEKKAKAKELKENKKA